MSDDYTRLNPGAGGDLMDEEGVDYGSEIRKRPRVVIGGKLPAELITPINANPAGTEWALPVRQVGSIASVTLGAGSAAIGTVTALEAPATVISATGAGGAALTLTLPGETGKFHYIYSLHLVMYSTAARTGGATPVVVNTSNLGTLAFTFPSAGAVGTTHEIRLEPASPIKSAAVGVNTTIGVTATTNVLWRFTAVYRSAA